MKDKDSERESARDKQKERDRERQSITIKIIQVIQKHKAEIIKCKNFIVSKEKDKELAESVFKKN